MADPELVKILQQGSEAWNNWRKQQRPDQNFDLSRANLRDSHLKGADLRQTNLYQAHLDYADLSKVNLGKANLTSATLCNANLMDAYLSGATLCNATLCNADLRYATLSRVNLSGSDLSGVLLFETIFTGVDLRNTKGLMEIQHQGPSSIALQSVQLPPDAIRPFLFGTGVPDTWIALYCTEIMHSVQYHSCFISYSSKDTTLAEHLYIDLQAQGVRCWFAPEDMKIGDKIRPRIDEAIYLQDKLLLLFSEHSIESDWVEVEVEAALEKERQQQREVLFPIRIDECVMETRQAWAATLRRTRHIGNFTNWSDPQAYQVAFERLLRDLKAEVNGGNNG